MTARTPQRQQLMQLLGPVITSQGYDLEDLSVTSAGRRSLIRVIVDGDNGIDLDAVAEVSRAVSDVLDTDEGGAAFAGPYVLEVSSPGVDRPLTEPRHWRRAAGRLVRVAVGEATITGRVQQADESSVDLLTDGGTVRRRYDELGPGHIEIEFNRTGTPADGEDAEFDDEHSGSDGAGSGHTEHGGSIRVDEEA